MLPPAASKSTDAAILRIKQDGSALNHLIPSALREKGIISISFFYTGLHLLIQFSIDLITVAKQLIK
jgi:hypothetical protein